MGYSNRGTVLHSGYARIKRALEPLRPIYDAWMTVIAGFSWLLVRVLLTLLFFTAFVLYSVVLAVTRRDPMRRTLRPDASSYWGENVVVNDSLEEFERLY
jgi:hypothetical protein